MIRLDITAATHVGLQRLRNEDRLVVGPFALGPSVISPVDVSCPPFPALVCVLDGMGGQTGGDVAAQTAADLVTGALLPASPVELVGLLEEANCAVYARAAAWPVFTAMGTTIAGLVVAGEQIFVFGVGDSRVYEIADGYLLPRTTDDAAPTGEITASLGGLTAYQPVIPEVRTLAPTDPTRFLVTTDGLFGHLTDEELEACLTDDRAITTRALIDAALAAGGPDNVTLAVVDAIPITEGTSLHYAREVTDGDHD